MNRVVAAVGLALACTSASAQSCFKTMISSPSPFMGQDGEVFKTTEGEIFKVIGAYEYLYAYYPQVVICPSRGRLVVGDKTMSVMALNREPPNEGRAEPKTRGSRGRVQQATDADNQVVYRLRGCKYFLADGPQGLYLLEYWLGHDPVRGEGIHGLRSTYGFQDLIYADGSEGRVYVQDYMLTKQRALEKMADKCGD